MTILINAPEWDPEPWAKLMRAARPGAKIVTATDAATLADVRYALVWKPQPGVLARCPKLEVIFNLGAGVDAILKDETIPKHIPIVRIVDPNMTMRMAEWVVLQVLIHHRRQLVYLQQQREAVWRDIPDQPAAEHVTVGMMGLGALGLHAAHALKALQFDLTGWSRTRKDVPGVRCFHGEQGLEAFLGETDVLVCLLPLTPETKGLLSRDLFRKLKRGGRLGGPVIINAGRGGEQVEADIVAALGDGTLAGASLDVFETEPLAKSSALWSHPRVVVTPHNAADSEPEALSRYLAAQMARHEKGLPLENVVGRERGY
jgi:glyoxylate/hydroxypyruvate reductase A